LAASFTINAVYDRLPLEELDRESVPALEVQQQQRPEPHNRREWLDQVEDKLVVAGGGGVPFYNLGENGMGSYPFAGHGEGDHMFSSAAGLHFK
jgi:hypothetical protein